MSETVSVDILMRQTRVRAAAPSTLFRGGGKTIADHMAAVRVPSWVPERFEAEYCLSTVLENEFSAASRVRSMIRESAAERRA